MLLFLDPVRSMCAFLTRPQAYLAILMSVLALCATTSAATINVPADQPTIQAAVNAAMPGDTIVVAPGIYAEVITVNKRVTIDGAGSGNNPVVDTIIDGSAAGFGSVDAAAITITGTGLDAANRLVIQDLRIVGSQFSSFNIGGTANASVSFLTLRDLVLDGTAAEMSGTYGMGVYIRGTGLMSDLLLDGIHASHFYNGGVAFNNFGSLTAIDGFTLTNSTLTQNRIGMHNYADGGSTTNENTFKNVTITDNLISENTWKGLYLEALSNAVIAGNTILHSGFGTGPQNGNGNGNTGIELNLKYGNHHDVEISRNEFDNAGIYMGAGNDVSGALAIKPRNIGSYAGNPATLTNAAVERNVFRNIPSVGGKAMLVGEYGTVIPANLTVTKNDLGDGTFLGIKNTTASGTVYAPLNWWGQSTGAGGGQTMGLVTTVPYISAYVDDPAHSADLGFFPLMTTVTTILSDGPDPTTVGQSYTISGTVQVTGLGGSAANDATLAGQVLVSDGTDSCTDMSVSDSGTLNLYDFSCTLTSTTTGSKTLTATYSDTSVDKCYNTSNDTEGHNVLACASVSTPVLTSHTTYPSATGVPITIPVNTSDMTGRGGISADFTFTYDPTVLSPEAMNTVTAGPVILHPPAMQSAVITYNATTPGTIIVSVFDTADFAGAGALVNINMRLIGQIGTSSPLTLSGFQYNGGLICANPVTSGTLTVISGTISGKVTYENTPGPVIPVLGTLLNAPGSPNVSDTTDLAGNYDLSGFGAGAYTVTPSRPNENYLMANGIFADDASRVAEHVVQLITLNPTQQRAGRVSGNMTLSSFDAALIAQWIVGIPSMINQTGQWKFTPVNRMYGPNINADLTAQNYDALLMGDVNGDWIAPTMRPAAAAPVPDDAIVVSLADITAAPGTVVNIPVRLENLNSRAISSYQFDVKYDPSVITPNASAADVTGTKSDGLGVISNSPVEGVLKVAVYGALPVTGDGVYLNLTFTVTGGVGAGSPVVVEGFRYNDGSAGVRTTKGAVYVTRGNGPAVSGKLLTPYGQPVQNTRVVLTGMTDGERTVLSDRAGRFEFSDMVVGRTVTITVVSGRYKFVPQTVSVSGDGTYVSMTATP